MGKVVKLDINMNLGILDMLVLNWRKNYTIMVIGLLLKITLELQVDIKVW